MAETNNEAQSGAASADAPSVLWSPRGTPHAGKNEPTSPWLRTCRVKEIRASPALIVVEVERSGELRRTEGRGASREDLDTLEDDLRKLGRGVSQAAWGSGLQRPVVLALVEPNAEPRALLDGLAANQEWHRGEFTLWPVKDRDGLEALLAPRVRALQFSSEERPKAKTVEERIHAFQQAQASAGAPHLAELVGRLHDELRALRAEPDDAIPLDEQDKSKVMPVVRGWLEAQLDSRAQEWASQAPPRAGLSSPLGLESYNPLPSPGAYDFFADATEEARRGWLERTKRPLLELRQQLLQRRRRELELIPQCTPAVAMYVGSVFHAATGIALVVHQQNQRTAQVEPWRRTQGKVVEPSLLTQSLRNIGGRLNGPPQELQVRISVAQDVRADADAWTAQRDSQKPEGWAVLALDLSMPDLGSTSVVDGDGAYAIALSVRKAIVFTRRERAPRLPLRLFFAGPSAVAVFIGAELNAMGTVHLMDFLKARRSYVESFKLEPGD